MTSGIEFEYSDVWEYEPVNWTLATAGLGALEQWQTAGLAVIAAGVSLVTICGNLIVLLSFILERSIRQPSNYFIASLAVSDLLIGTPSTDINAIILSAQTDRQAGVVRRIHRRELAPLQVIISKHSALSSRLTSFSPNNKRAVAFTSISCHSLQLYNDSSIVAHNTNLFWRPGQTSVRISAASYM